MKMTFEAQYETWILKQLRTPSKKGFNLYKAPTAFDGGMGLAQPQASSQPQPQGGMLSEQRSSSGDDKKGRTTNYIRIQQRPVEDYKDGQFKTIEFGEKIKAVYGRVGGSGSKNPGKWAIQTLLFPKDTYTIDSATQWARTHGFKVGNGGVQPGQAMSGGLGQPQMQMGSQPQPKMDMAPYLGGPAPVQAQGTKQYKPNSDGWRTGEPYQYNDVSGRWEPTQKSLKIDLEKGLEVAIGGIPGVPGVFCDWCHVAIGAYKKYGNFHLCGKCYETTGRLRFEK